MGIKRTLTEIISWIILIAGIILSFYFYTHFPALVPSHWNIQGQINGYSSRGFGAFFMPLLAIALYFLLSYIPYLDPHRERYAEFESTYQRFKLLIVAFFITLYILFALRGLGYMINLAVAAPFFVGLLFFFLGIFMPKIKRNWFFGIRTPWTISSEEVWNKTHKLGGQIFMAGGLILVALSITPVLYKFVYFVVVIACVTLIPIIYSYVIYRHEQIGQ